MKGQCFLDEDRGLYLNCDYKGPGVSLNEGDWTTEVEIKNTLLKRCPELAENNIGK